MLIIYEPSGRAREYSHLALNHYTGCAHGCEYCYVPAVLRISKEIFHGIVAPRKNVLGQIEKDAAKITCTNKRVLLCFTCDPYQPLDDDLGLTREVIKILKRHSIPMQILTKGGMRAARDFDLYDKYDAFATTLTFMDPDDSAKWEPGAASPANRIEAIKEAKERGIQTWVSLEPVIDPEQSLEIIEQTNEFMDHYKIGKWNYDKRAKDIDWRQFGMAAGLLCELYGKSYYIKNDLAKFLNGVKFHNTDTRIVV